MFLLPFRLSGVTGVHDFPFARLARMLQLSGPHACLCSVASALQRLVARERTLVVNVF